MEEFDNHSDASDVRKFWGIQDVSTSVGKWFRYEIPRDAFKGTVIRYEVQGEDGGTLPKWLIFNEKKNLIEGVPSVEDIGDTRVNVKAYDNRGNFVVAVFIIEVYPLFEKDTVIKGKCKKGEGIMMIAVTIDKSLNEISPSLRISAMQKLSNHLNISPNILLLLSQTIPAEDVGLSDTLSSQSYRDKKKYENVNSSIITWQIGCNERIWAEELRVVKLVKKYVRDGSLSKLLSLPVSQWRLVSSFSLFRIRRNTPDHNDTMIDDDDDDNDDNEDASDNDPDYPDGDSNTETKNQNPGLSPTSSTLANNGFSTSVTYGSNSTLESTFSIENENDDHYEETGHGSDNRKLDTYGGLQPSPDESVTDAFPDDLEDEIEARSNISSAYGRGTPELDSSQVSVTSDILSTTVSSNVTTENPIIVVTTTRTRGPPTINRKLEPKSIIAGKLYIEKIPEDIFRDDEDGNTRNLTLTLIKPQTKNISETCSPYTTWIDLDAKNQTLYMLASLDAISALNSTIIATNSANMSVSDTLIVHAQYPSTAFKVNFEMSLYLRPKENQELSVRLQLQLIEALAKLYGDPNYEKITVRRVKCGDPFIFTWTNNTLSLDSCENETIINLITVLAEGLKSVNVNKKTREILGSLFTVEKVTWTGSGLCEDIPTAQLPRPPKQNFKPVLRNHIDNITARAGELRVFHIPEDSFYDAEVNNMRDSKLSLWTMDSMSLPKDNWLQFDEKNREIYGLPMTRDVGVSKYRLVCHDNENTEKNAVHTIEVVVEQAVKMPYNVEFSMTLSSSFEDFNRSPLQRRTFVEKLATVFGDKDTTSIVVSGYAPGSVIVVWHNKSLPVDRCPEEEIEHLRKKLLKDTRELNEHVNHVMAPEFHAISALVTPIGVCEGGSTELHATDVNTASQEIHSIIFSGNLSYHIREYFFEIILPVIIIVLMMFLAGIIACVLYRKQRSSKWRLGDEDERRTYRSKGIPVIFQDELEERLEPTNKSPIIMKEEKPPLPPPEYQKTLPVATTALLSDFDDASYPQESGASGTRSTERNGRSKPTPNYRKPPPYVPP